MRRKKIPAFIERRRRARGLVVGEQLVWTPDDVIALIDRVNGRYRALALSVAETAPDETGDPLGLPWREAWAAQYRSWLDFAEAGRGLWGSAWGSTASTAQAFDEELSEFRAQFEERTGTEVPGAAHDTAEQGRPGPDLSQALRGFGSGAGLAAVAVAGLVGVGLYLSRR